MSVFSKAACLSSTFGHAEDLFHRIATEPRRPNLKIYLDSGWPGDNFEVTRAMFDLLQSKGYVPDQEVKYLVFPAAQHNEADWANRLHIPFQFFFTKYAEFERDDARRSPVWRRPPRRARRRSRPAPPAPLTAELA